MPTRLPPLLQAPASSIARRVGLARLGYRLASPVWRSGRFAPAPRRFPVTSPAPVALLVDSLDRGGLEEMVFDLATTLDPARYRPLAVCVERGGAVADRLRSAGIAVHVLERSEAAWSALLARERVAVVNAHYTRFGLRQSRALGIPTVHVLHNSYVWLNERGAARFAASFAGIDHFVAVSSSVARYARRRFGIGPERLELVPNGIRLERLDLDRREERRARMRSVLGVAEDAVVFLLPGTYEPRKGHHAAIPAFEALARRHARAVLVCVGGSPEPS
ncbi:MAG: glycosyltransferase, partial [Myxococcales bacterium]